MSSQDISLKLEERQVVGKGLTKLRAEGRVPAVLHNHGKESIHVEGDYVPMLKVYAEAGKHHPVNLQISGKNHLALIKHVDIEPTKQRLRHVVFQAIRQNEEVEAEIPVVFKDVEIPAEKVSLLVLKQLDHVQVKALPKDLPDELVVDPSTLKADGDHLTVADLEVPAGVTILTELETSIASVETPRDQIAEADASAASLAEDAGQTGEPETPEETPEGGREEEVSGE